MIAERTSPPLPEALSASGWRNRLAELLEPGEQVAAWLETDLDGRLDFADGLLALTQRRLVTLAAGGEPTSMPLAGGLRIAHQDHAGVGRLTLVDESARLAVWRYTISRAPQALDLVDAFDRMVAGVDAPTLTDAASRRLADGPAPPAQRVAATAGRRTMAPMRPMARTATTKRMSPMVPRRSGRPRPGCCSGCGALRGLIACGCSPGSC